MKLKRPVSISPAERRQERQIKLMAMHIPDQAALELLLMGSSPDMRAAMLEKVRPYLPFTPEEEVNLDCPACGMKRGSILAHECVLN